MTPMMYIQAGFVFLEEGLTFIRGITLQKPLSVPPVETSLILVFQLGAFRTDAFHGYDQGRLSSDPKINDFGESSSSAWQREAHFCFIATRFYFML